MGYVLDAMLKQQQRILYRDLTPPPPHNPKALFIGCVDARVVLPKLGIPEGEALIFRDIAALVAKQSSHGERHVSEEAVLSFAVNVKGVKEIIVMGHTDCGGIGACLDAHPTPEMEAIRRYLKPLERVRDDVVRQGGDKEQQARAMEQAAVRESLNNLMTYEPVRKAVEAGTLELTGLMLDTGTGLLSKMDPDTGKFSLMNPQAYPAMAGAAQGWER